MARQHIHKSRAGRGESGGSWISYSDLMCALLLMFVWFGILKPLDTWAQAGLDLASRQESLSQAAARMAQWEDLEQAYLRWGRDQLQPQEKALVNRDAVLELVQAQIAPHASIRELILNENELTLQLGAITLEQASQLMDALESGPLVSRAVVVSASVEEGKDTRIHISITLSRKENADETS